MNLISEMLTRRDNVLTKPWLQRRYESHRTRVKSAVPAIDFGPPMEMKHIQLKQRKMRQEQDRVERILIENCKLLNRLASLANKTRVDHINNSPIPKFLPRVGIYLPNEQNRVAIIERVKTGHLTAVGLPNQIVKLPPCCSSRYQRISERNKSGRQKKETVATKEKLKDSKLNHDLASTNCVYNAIQSLPL